MLIIKGIIIGIGKIIPGVSGAMLAISMGIYQKLIDSVNSIFTNTKDSLKFLFKIGIGVLLSIIFFSNIILKCLNNYYLITIFFFIGLIIGSMDEIKTNIKKRNKFIIFTVFTIISLLGLINIKNDINIQNSLFQFLFFVLVGLIDAITMVVPGISGTATLMMIGAYDTLMDSFANILNISQFIKNIQILFPFVIGMIIGIFITVKIINYLFNNFKNQTYNAIIGFSLSTVFIMAFKCLNTSYTLLQLILAFIFFFIAVFLSKKINHYISND